jgi:uncharacterized membrane protein YgcG
MSDRPHLIIPLLLAAFLVASFGAQPAIAQPAPAQPASTPSAAKRTAAELEQMVAPIALYPDDLLAQVLMASTYPLEVVEAARWSKENPQVTGAALRDAMQTQEWDPSVRALTAVPQTLQLMNDKLGWMQDLGDAFLAQERDVMAAVQRLRARADANGQLNSGPQQKVTKVVRPPASAGAPARAVAPEPVYTIEPVNPGEYYVPIYDPGTVYGAWPYPDDAPFYWYPQGYAAVGAFSFAAAAITGAAIWGRANWWRGNVGVHVGHYNQFNRANIAGSSWSHNVNHRRGVPYRDQGVASRFGDQGRATQRDSIRNRQSGAGNPGRTGNAGQKSNLGQKTKVGQKGNLGQKTKVGQKGNIGQKGQAARGGNRQGANRAAAARPAGRASNVNRGGGRPAAARTGGGRGMAGHVGGGARMAGRSAGLGMAGGGRGGGFRGAGGGGFRGGGGMRGGGGRRSDINLKHDIMLLGRLDSGLGFYRFRYHGSDTAYVGVMAQEVQGAVPDAVTRGSDGTLRVRYERLGLRFQTYHEWIRSGGRVPVAIGAQH